MQGAGRRPVCSVPGAEVLTLTAELQSLGGGDVAVGRGWAAAALLGVAAAQGSRGPARCTHEGVVRLGERRFELDAAAGGPQEAAAVQAGTVQALWTWLAGGFSATALLLDPPAELSAAALLGGVAAAAAAEGLQLGLEWRLAAAHQVRDALGATLQAAEAPQARAVSRLGPVAAAQRQQAAAQQQPQQQCPVVSFAGEQQLQALLACATAQQQQQSQRRGAAAPAGQPLLLFTLHLQHPAQRGAAAVLHVVEAHNSRQPEEQAQLEQLVGEVAELHAQQRSGEHMLASARLSLTTQVVAPWVAGGTRLFVLAGLQRSSSSSSGSGDLEQLAARLELLQSVRSIQTVCALGPAAASASTASEQWLPCPRFLQLLQQWEEVAAQQAAEAAARAEAGEARRERLRLLRPRSAPLKAAPAAAAEEEQAEEQEDAAGLKSPHKENKATAATPAAVKRKAAAAGSKRTAAQAYQPQQYGSPAKAPAAGNSAATSAADEEPGSGSESRAREAVAGEPIQSHEGYATAHAQQLEQATGQQQAAGYAARHAAGRTLTEPAAAGAVSDWSSREQHGQAWQQQSPARERMRELQQQFQSLYAEALCSPTTSSSVGGSGGAVSSSSALSGSQAAAGTPSRIQQLQQQGQQHREQQLHQQEQQKQQGQQQQGQCPETTGKWERILAAVATADSEALRVAAQQAQQRTFASSAAGPPLQRGGGEAPAAEEEEEEEERAGGEEPCTPAWLAGGLSGSSRLADGLHEQLAQLRLQAGEAASWSPAAADDTDGNAASLARIDECAPSLRALRPPGSGISYQQQQQQQQQWAGGAASSAPLLGSLPAVGAQQLQQQADTADSREVSAGTQASRQQQGSGSLGCTPQPSRRTAAYAAADSTLSQQVSDLFGSHNLPPWADWAAAAARGPGRQPAAEEGGPSGTGPSVGGEACNLQPSVQREPGSVASSCRPSAAAAPWGTQVEFGAHGAAANLHGEQQLQRWGPSSGGATPAASRDQLTKGVAAAASAEVAELLGQLQQEQRLTRTLLQQLHAAQEQVWEAQASAALAARCELPLPGVADPAGFDATLAALQRERQASQVLQRQLAHQQQAAEEERLGLEAQLATVQRQLVVAEGRCRAWEGRSPLGDVFQRYQQEAAALLAEARQLRRENGQLAQMLAEAELLQLEGAEEALPEDAAAVCRELHRKLQQAQAQARQLGVEKAELQEEVEGARQRERLAALYRRQAEEGVRRAAELQQQLARAEAARQVQALAAAEAAAETHRAAARAEGAEQQLGAALAERADLQDAVQALRQQVALLRGQLGRDRVLQLLQSPSC